MQLKDTVTLKKKGSTESFSISNEAAVVDNEHEIVRDYEEENMNQIETIAMQYIGGEIEIDVELLSIDLNTDNGNDPLLENHATFLIIEYFYDDWGPTGICYRKQIVSTNPTLKVRLSESFNCVQLFELLYMKEYLRDVVLKNFNENIVGHLWRAT